MGERIGRSSDYVVDTGVSGVLSGVLFGLDAWGRSVPVGQVRSDLVLGRDPRCGTVLTPVTISRQHARISQYAPGQFMIEDLGSRNGTYVNGQPVTAPRELRDGDLLGMGYVQLQFRLVQDDALPAFPRRPSLAETVHVPGPTQPVLSPSGLAARSEPRGSSGTATVLALAVLESLLGAAVSQAIPAGRAWAYALAVVTPLIGTALVLRENGKVRYGAVTLVTALAVALTVAGVTVADFTLGRSVFPWSTSTSTFVPVPDGGTATAPKVTVPKVVGVDDVSATQALIRAGFHPQNVLRLDAPSSRGSAGKVVRTEPAAGQKVPNNAVVKIYIGRGRSR
jgi:hypothetical protein